MPARLASLALLNLALLISALGCGDDEGPADAMDTGGDTRAMDTNATDTNGMDATDATDTSAIDTGADTDASTASWRSSLYPDDWTPAFTVDGAFLHDFSYAGAFQGERALPFRDGPIFDVTTYGATADGSADATAAFQEAIDAAELDGGVVRVPAGDYRVDGVLVVDASGVVMRGEGAASRIFFSRSEGMSDGAHLLFRGGRATSQARPLSADGQARAQFVRVGDTDGLAVGDEIAIGFRITTDFIERHGMTDTWVTFVDQYKHMYRRTITSLEGGEVRFDVPLRDEVRVSDGAMLQRLDGVIREVGVEQIAMSNANTEDAAWSLNRAHLVRMEWVADAWIDGLTSFASTLGDGEAHVMSGGIKILDSHRVTVQRSEISFAQNRGPGGNGYLFEVSRSNEVLFADDVARRGRHGFIQNWDHGTSGVVWLRCQSLDGQSLTSRGGIPLVGLSEFHHSLATANLIDSNTANDGWAAVNRNGYSSGAGHSAKENVFWNHRGASIRSFQFGRGYVIGTEDVEVFADLEALDLTGQGRGTEPMDLIEGEGAARTLEPSSLYEDQLARRLSAL